jgi:hypothetical protein
VAGRLHHGRVTWRAIAETYKKRPIAEELVTQLEAASRPLPDKPDPDP